LNNQDPHINNILREKFDSFRPVPPPHVWEGIEKSLDADKGFFIGNSKYFATVLLLAALIPFAYFAFDYSNNKPVTYEDNTKNTVEKRVLLEEEETPLTKSLEEDKTAKPVNETIEIKKSTEQLLAGEKIVKTSNSQKSVSSNQNNTANTNTSNFFGLKKGFEQINTSDDIELLNTLTLSSVYLAEFGHPYLKSNTASPIIEISGENKKKSGHWENTIFFSPEFSLTNLDSITILNSYSLGVEPSRYFNKNWFVRFGVNVSYTGDRGFAKIDYVSNDLMGTYDDVYDVTFDTIGGLITPIYHTKTVEVWDSIRHIVVSEVTNRYLFAQVPVLLGYKNKIGQLNWYAYAGPAIGFQIAKWIDEPSAEFEDIEIIDLENNLPLRATINYQLWVGAGIEYKLGANTSIVIEPSFRHAFTSLYSDEKYKFSTSGFALRLGFNYKIGR